MRTFCKTGIDKIKKLCYNTFNKLVKCFEARKKNKMNMSKNELKPKKTLVEALAYNQSKPVENLLKPNKIIRGLKMGLEKTMKALADPVRREILDLLKKGRLAAGDIVAHFDITGAAISRHLSILKEADLIRDTREGKFIYYELNASVLEEILMWIATLKGEKND